MSYPGAKSFIFHTEYIFSIVVSQLSDSFQPLHVVYSQNCLSPIKRLLIADKLKITGFYKEMSRLSIPEEKIKPFDKDARLFLNTAEDLQHIDKK